jgi:hypothetical protein
VAAAIRRELGEEVEKRSGAYGEFKVLVDGEVVADGGALGFLGVLPAVGAVIDRVRERLAAPRTRDAG